MENNVNVTPIPEKCYTIYSTSETCFGANLKDISEETFHGLRCLRGISIRKGSWTEGKIIYIPIQQVAMVVEFDSFEDFQHSRRKLSKRVSGLFGSICRSSR